MLSRADGKRTGKKPKRDPKLPSPRFPEALYYYLFILIEASILIGVWGYVLTQSVEHGPNVPWH